MTDNLEEAVKAVEAAHAMHDASIGNKPEKEEQAPVETEESEQEPEVEEAEGNEAEAEASSDDSEAEETSDSETGEEDDASDDTDEDSEESKKRRSKPASVRIAELTAKLREAERKLEAANQPEPEGQEAEAPVEPSPDDFEYGEADPAYLRALAKYDREVEKVDERKQQKEVQQRQAMLDRINAGMEKAAAEAAEKYEDFDERIAEAVQARGGQSLPPMLSIGISMSPVGGDIAYRLATDEAASARLEGLAKSGETANQMAMALGELEGEYLTDTSDADLDMSDQLDMARMMGRMRARVAGRTAPAPKREEVPPKVVPTNAPEPPAKRVRGSAGKARASMDTEDTAAFVRDFGKKLGL